MENFEPKPPGAADQRRLQDLCSLMDCIGSLQDAVRSAGGAPLSYRDLCNMNAARLLCLLATNGIRFTNN